MPFSLLDRFITQFIAETQTPGVVAAITDRERTLQIAAHGYADREARRPVTAETLFPIASATKILTAVATLRLYQEGRLDLHGPVRHYLPWLPEMWGAVTLHHLLTHTAGLPNGRYDIPDSRFVLTALAEATPGSHFTYSNIGYDLITAVLETVTGMSFGELLQASVLAPLGMAQSAPITTNDLRPRLSTGYQPLYDDRPAQRSHPLVTAPWVELRTGSGGAASTAEDLCAFLRMLLNGGRPLLGNEAFSLLTQPAVPFGPGHYGYGLASFQRDGCTRLWHNGGNTGHGAWLMADVTDGIGIAVLINSHARAFMLRDYALGLVKATRTGAPPPPPPPVQPRWAPDAGAYAGTYGTGEHRFTLRQGDEGLVMEWAGGELPLEQTGPDSFLVNHPAWERFCLTFGRGPEGGVVEAFHGAAWYPHQRYAGPRQFTHPPEWKAYPGHYRASHPWWNSFHVVLRKGALWKLHPFMGDQPLLPLSDGSFRAGGDDWSPERIRFDSVTEGRALRLTESGCHFYRVWSS